MLIQTYNATATKYAKHEFDNPEMKKHFEKFLSLIPKNSKISDVDCGFEQAANRFVKYRHKVIGINLSEKMIEFAKSKVLKPEFLVIDIENITLNEKFDAIWSGFVLNYLPREKH